MAPSSKNAAAAKDRRKSSNTAAVAVTSAASSKPSKIVTIKVPPHKLRAIIDPDFVPEDTPAKQSPAAALNSGNENVSDSTPNSPPAGTPAAQSSSMGPPTEGPKKRGVKRSAGAAANGNGEPKIRGKPGPKKKQRLEDGTVEGGRGSVPAHKLGPKANQGAINAGLRALDRSGKPCRRWQKGGFTLKSFTGVVWEIPRWTAPPRSRPESSAEGSTPASEGSNKENKEDNSQIKSEASNNGGDVEMQGTPSFAADNSPAPVPIAAA
ncbi:DUF1711-domain-containing protein [Parathielavia appendiculata]|uniref:DUF1711-domain-containing protein n=1 Tax=Parathielavia appendiculata TaxID=2587402 RepID=A0AAN6Z0P8_9PEZI|nr:DUF1711-domain-containing protein [Parathielavia appendiculata]